MSWIKLEHATPDKPEVWEMAGILGIDPDAVFGKVLRVWIWADQNCNASGVTSVTLVYQADRLTGVAGFGKAMVSVGWIEVDGNTCRLPNFDRHNGKPAKTRALTAKRVGEHRAKASAKCNDDNVTDVTEETLPDKRRIESTNNNNPREGLPCVDGYPTKAQAIAAAGNQMIPEHVAASWWLARDGQGWQGKNGHPMPPEAWQSNLKGYSEIWKTNEAMDKAKPKRGTIAANNRHEIDYSLYGDREPNCKP